MRTEFFKLLKEEMAKDKEIFLLVADMGMGLIEPFQKEFPDRFINVGISEQNMIGVAAGLCNVGYRPFCYTISNFLIERCFEQIRNDICLHKYPITLVGTSTGFDNGMLGPTHQVIDDIGCTKILPGMNIYSPGAIGSMKIILGDIIKNKKPAYVRIGKSSYNIELVENSTNHMIIERPASDILIITHGTLLENCAKAANLNNRLSVYYMEKIKPLDNEKMKELFTKFSKIVVIEDHFITSGLYNSLCQLLVEMDYKSTTLLGIGTPEIFEVVAGDKNYFADRYGYSPEKIAQFVSNYYAKNG